MTLIHAEFEETIRLRDQGDPSGSLKVLSRLAESPDATSAIFAVMGGFYWEIRKLPEAITAFRKAIVMSPRSEDASLGLFHTLLESNRIDDAFSEMKRFLSVADSLEYQTLFKEIQQTSENG